MKSVAAFLFVKGCIPDQDTDARRWLCVAVFLMLDCQQLRAQGSLQGNHAMKHCMQMFFVGMPEKP